MRLETRQDGSDCLKDSDCPALSCANACPSDKVCTFTVRGCKTCPYVVCAPKPGAASSGISTGALAGSVVSVFSLAIVACTAFFWWRRRQTRARALPEKTVVPRDVPANPEAVLSRPDPIEKPLPTPARSHFTASDAASHRSVAAESFLTHDPFADQASIQTASARTHSPNVITIGIMPPPDGVTALSPPPAPGPQRPVRSPDLSLRSDNADSMNLAHVNVSNDSLQPPSARFAKAKSARSVRTNASRASTFSNASSALDILTEVPQIVTPVQGAVRQVLGVVKAEVVQVPAGAYSPGLSAQPGAPVRPRRSPLAQNSFTPDDIHEENPFGDAATRAIASSSTSVKSDSTFGQHNTPTQWSFPPTPTWPVDSRMSVQSNVGTIIADIGSATRVVFGMQSPQYAVNAHLKAHDSTSTMASSAQPGTPPPTAQDINEAHRLSQASVASSHADSILEAFPFVPPSPIAARPPRSPMGVTFTPPSPDARLATSLAIQQTQGGPPSGPPTPTQRSTRALSTLSNSSGLTQFPFKFSDDDTPPVPAAGKRASLDTLALSRDLEAFPLPYDDPLRSSYAPSTK